MAFFIILATTLSAGCATRAVVPIEKLHEPPCSSASGIEWAGPKAANDRTRLSAWCQSVGPVLVTASNLRPVDINESGLVVLTWNQHEDYGDLERLLYSFAGRSPVIALLQEVARTSDSVPLEVSATVRVPGRIGANRKTTRGIEEIARDFHLSLAYLPSMPNGARTHEDRGCAILSTLPLSEVMGIELPWVSQRRVAVMATVTAMRNGVPWRLRAVSVHLDNRWGRSRQAAAIADYLAQQKSSANIPTILGGDLNAWYGIDDQAVREIDRVVPRVRECGKRATFRPNFGFGMRLDHLFTTLPPQTYAGCVVERERFGSDHHPIVLQLFKGSDF